MNEVERPVDTKPEPGAQKSVPMSAVRLQKGGPGDEEMPRAHVTRRQAIAVGIFVLSAIAFLYFVLPKISGPNGLTDSWRRIENGDPWWLLAGVVLELCSFAGYIVLFRAVFARDYEQRIGWKESYQITMAGLAATRLFATAGAGGVALTAWALGRSQMPARVVACRMVAFLVLLYAVYALSFVIVGLGLGSGLFPGGGSPVLTYVPAIIGAALIGVVGLVALLPRDAERRLAQWGSHSGRIARVIARGVSVPATAASGVRTAIDLVRGNDPKLLGAVAWWGFDICVLWACFHAFGTAPPFAVVWMAYFIGQLGNLLPLPGGIGGVDGGLIGAFAAFGVDFNLAVVSVLAYRLIAFWLPTVPGAFAYLQLRHTVKVWKADTEEHEVTAEQVSRPAPA